MYSLNSFMLRVPIATRHNFVRSISSDFLPSYCKNGRLPNFIEGKFVESQATQWFDVTDPVSTSRSIFPSIDLHLVGHFFTLTRLRLYAQATNEVIAQVPQSTPSELKAAVNSASAAFPEWRASSVMRRQRIFHKYLQLVNDNHTELAKCIVRENGKVLADAMGDVFRGIEVIERATSVAQDMMGETAEQLSPHIDTYSYRQPLGVCAGIAPFNFPAMIPLWMFPLALACGNTYVMKPSERVRPAVFCRVVGFIVFSTFRCP
jgi:malonate-semialdehyde dehydrogenase (acetylating)/methylmalonate-semialdehyde dehydrogenase